MVTLERKVIPITIMITLRLVTVLYFLLLQVLVLSFALFLGTWSPLTGYGMGQHSMGPLPLPVSRGMGGIRGGIASTLARDASKVPMGPQLGDAYSTPNGMCGSHGVAVFIKYILHDIRVDLC